MKQGKLLDKLVQYAEQSYRNSSTYPLLARYEIVDNNTYAVIGSERTNLECADSYQGPDKLVRVMVSHIPKDNGEFESEAMPGVVPEDQAVPLDYMFGSKVYDPRDGICRGFVELWFYHIFTDTEGKFEHRASLLNNWKPGLESKQTAELLDSFINSIMFLQYDCEYRRQIPSNFLHERFSLLVGDDYGCAVNTHNICSVFNPRNLKNLLTEQLKFSEADIAKGVTSKFYRLDDFKHTIGIALCYARNGNLVYKLYDPNRTVSQHTTINQLVSAVFRAFNAEARELHNNAIAINVLCYSYTDKIDKEYSTVNGNYDVTRSVGLLDEGNITPKQVESSYFLDLAARDMATDVVIDILRSRPEIILKSQLRRSASQVAVLNNQPDLLYELLCHGYPADGAWKSAMDLDAISHMILLKAYVPEFSYDKYEAKDLQNRFNSRPYKKEVIEEAIKLLSVLNRHHTALDMIPERDFKFIFKQILEAVGHKGQRQNFNDSDWRDLNSIFLELSRLSQKTFLGCGIRKSIAKQATIAEQKLCSALSKQGFNQVEIDNLRAEHNQQVLSFAELCKLSDKLQPKLQAK